MIRRFRVALKHSSPIYAEKRVGLMPSLLGVPVNRYRLFVLFICLLFVYTWHGQNQSHAEQMRLSEARIAQLQQEFDSVAEKLRIIWQHKKKLEANLNAQTLETDKFLSKIKLKESEIYRWKTKNEHCLKELSGCEKNGKREDQPRIEEKKNKKEDDMETEMDELKKRITELEGTLNKTEMESKAKTGSIKEELKHCEAKIKMLTGGGAIEHYSQNETAHFNRNHKADEPLSFDRGNIQHHIPAKLLLGRQLAETLEEAKVRKLKDKEQMDKHPQDRDNKDQEVNEQPDGEEQDYKEH